MSIPRAARALGLLLAASFLVASCSSGGNDNGAAESTDGGTEAPAATDADTDDPVVSVVESPRGGSVTVLVQQDPAPIVGWTPWDHVCAWGCRSVLDQVLETLTVVLPDGSVEPWLAESVTPNNELTEWTVVLREGVEFSDGEPMVASRIKEAFDEFYKEGKATEGLLRDARVAGVVVVDERTLIYELSDPNAGLPAFLAGPAGRVFSVEAARTDAAAFLRAPVGTGPFVFSQWAVGEDAILVANPDYWRDDLPVLDELRFVTVEDEMERLDQLRAGAGQISQTRAPRAVQQARGLELTVVSRIEDNVGAVVFNALEPPFDDARIRRALLLASNQQALLDASGVGDVSPPATQWWSPESIWYSERAAEAWPDTDLEEARRLLTEYQNDPLRTDELEVGSPIDIRLQCTDDLQLENMMRALAEQWRATGLANVSLETVSRSGIIQRVMGSITDRPSFSGEFTVSCWRLGGESDPWPLLTTALGPVKTSPLNVSNLEDERLQDLVLLVQESRTQATRHAAIEQIMLTFGVEVPAIYLGHAVSAVVGTEAIDGLGAWTLPDGRSVFGYAGGVGRFAEVSRR